LEERFARRLAEELGELRKEFYLELSKVWKEIGKLRGEMKTEIESLRTEMKTEIGSLRSDLIRWMFIFWVGQFVALASILIAFLRLLG